MILTTMEKIMKQMSKTILILFTIVLFLSISGCGNTNDETIGNNESVINSNDGRMISISKLKSDILENPSIQTCFTSPFTTESEYSVTGFEIIKEQINDSDKNIITYSDVTVENEYFSVNLQLKTVYNFYDIGGWIMDELYIEEITHVTPTRGPSPELVEEYIIPLYSISGFYQGKEHNLILENNVFSVTESVLINPECSNVFAQYQTDNVTITGTFMFFFSEEGWTCDVEKPAYHIVEYTADYSQALGSFSTESGPVVQSVDLNVISIDGTTVTYDLNEFSMPGFSYSVQTGTNLTSEFDPITGDFWIGNYAAVLGSTPLYLSYNSNTDTWSVAFSNLSRK